MKTEVTYRGGSGAQGSMEVVGECEKCHGGYVRVTAFVIDECVQSIRTCPDCHGTGREVKD